MRMLLLYMLLWSLLLHLRANLLLLLHPLLLQMLCMLLRVHATLYWSLQMLCMLRLLHMLLFQPLLLILHSL